MRQLCHLDCSSEPPGTATDDGHFELLLALICSHLLCAEKCVVRGASNGQRDYDNVYWVCRSRRVDEDLNGVKGTALNWGGSHAEHAFRKYLP